MHYLTRVYYVQSVSTLGPRGCIVKRSRGDTMYSFFFFDVEWYGVKRKEMRVQRRRQFTSGNLKSCANSRLKGKRKLSVVSQTEGRDDGLRAVEGI